MTIREASWDEIESVVRPNKKSVIRCKAAPKRVIRAVFPAWHLLTSKDHVHLSNPHAAWEFDPTSELAGKLQEGLCYVFLATWESEAYVLPDGRTALSLEQVFRPDDVYRYRPKSLICHERDGRPVARHRWNGHNGSLKVLYRIPDEAVGEMALGMAKDKVLLAKKQGPYAGVWELSTGSYDFVVTPGIGPHYEGEED